MRIVGGAWRGRTFQPPVGRGTRPTTDRMRESIASSILSACDLELEGLRVLDAFAGSGGMGLELLSRGAAWCTFCERDRRTADLVRRNCKSLEAGPGQAEVVAGDVFRLASGEAGARPPFDIVFLDPPYALPATEVARLLDGLARNGWLASACLVVYERSVGGGALAIDGFRHLRTKRSGGTAIDLLRRGGAQ